jgi:hypothetical protein
MPESEVNIRKMIQTQRDSYQVPDGEEWRITVSELIANSLDSKATWIKISVKEWDKPDFFTIICEDNGNGMNRENFNKYHDIYTITKSRKSGTIGFAGIGAKLTLDLCKKVITETKSYNDNYYHSDWYFIDRANAIRGLKCSECNEDINGEKPHYHILNDVNKQRDVRQEMGEHTGTYVEVVNLRTKNLDEDSLRRYVMAEYQYSIILKNVIIFLNDKKLKPLVPEGDEIDKEYKYRRSYSTKGKVGSEKLELLGHFYYVKDAYKNRVSSENSEEIYSGIDIVVFGKRILRYTFGIERKMKAVDSQYVYGYIECDQLIDIVEPSKDGFNLKSGLWKFFEAKVTSDIENWLKEIGKFNEEFWKGESHAKTKEIGKLMEVLWNKFPSLIDDLFGTGGSEANRNERPEDQTKGGAEHIEIYNPGGDIPGSLTDNGTLTSGIFGGGGTSEGPSVPSSDEGSESGVIPDDAGNIRISKKRYKSRKPKVDLYFTESPVHDAVWWDSNKYAFAINVSHPGYEYSKAKGAGANDLYIISTIVDLLISLNEKISTDEKQKKETIYSLYHTLLSG